LIFVPDKICIINLWADENILVSGIFLLEICTCCGKTKWIKSLRQRRIELPDFYHSNNTYFQKKYLASLPIMNICRASALSKTLRIFAVTNSRYMPKSVYTSLLSKKAGSQKSFAVLIDPDKVTPSSLDKLCSMCLDAKVDYFFVGGSLVVSNRLDEVIIQIKKNCDIPILLFPGSPSQISRHGDALLYLSLISGRNADLLIGQHVISAPSVKQSGLEIIPVGYMVIDAGSPTTVSYISNALPIPCDRHEIAMCTAMAGEMLGMKLIYMDAGSGAKRPVHEDMIAVVAQNITVPLVVGGGITDPEKAYHNCKAGADLIVIGNAIEKDPSLISDMAAAIHMVSLKTLKN
jgi:putative glycerol-1-phosphate prenyltransferase